MTPVVWQCGNCLSEPLHVQCTLEARSSPRLGLHFRRRSPDLSPCCGTMPCGMFMMLVDVHILKHHMAIAASATEDPSHSHSQ